MMVVSSATPSFFSHSARAIFCSSCTALLGGLPACWIFVTTSMASCGRRCVRVCGHERVWWGDGVRVLGENVDEIHNSVHIRSRDCHRQFTLTNNAYNLLSWSRSPTSYVLHVHTLHPLDLITSPPRTYLILHKLPEPVASKDDAGQCVGVQIFFEHLRVRRHTGLLCHRVAHRPRHG